MIENLGPVEGMAGTSAFRSTESKLVEYACCNTFSLTESEHHRPTTLGRAPTDPAWATCLTETAMDNYNSMVGEAPPPSCLRYSFLADSCMAALTECPEPPAADPSCPVACPMANDGVCDEPGGTGLCPAGCDTNDCACPNNTQFQCDEAWFGQGSCPLGSDPDCLAS